MRSVEKECAECHLGLKNRVEKECRWAWEGDEGRWKGVKAHSEDWTLVGDGVGRKRDVGDPGEELGEDYPLQGKAGLCRIDALGVRWS
jgi:hypothetical protein